MGSYRLTGQPVSRSVAGRILLVGILGFLRELFEQGRAEKANK